ncbi:MAG: molecular chaperone GrpE [Gammaproteobacteria bacterium]|jgi:molecular chaperone GrpE
MSSKKPKVEDNQESVAPELKDAEERVEGEEVNTSADSEAESIEQQLQRTQETVKDYWDQIMRLKAEMENNRKRAIRDVENAHKFALKNFTEALLPVIDSMDMGQHAAVAENATLESIIEGTDMTTSMFVQVLEKHGLKRINPMGEKFDPEQHQAISMIEDENVESDHVISVMQKGFSLNDRLVRPAMVIVAK